jgi:hypothetical protein
MMKKKEKTGRLTVVASDESGKTLCTYVMDADADAKLEMG